MLKPNYIPRDFKLTAICGREFEIAYGGIAQLVERLNGIQEVAGSTPTISTKKGLSEHCCFKKRYSDSFYFTKRRDAMKSVLFSYILHYPFLFAFRWGYRRISQRICQRHGKIARKHFIYKDRVRLDNEFGSFFISRHYFSLKGLWSLTYSTAIRFSFLMFRLMPSCPCRKAENKKGVIKK